MHDVLSRRITKLIAATDAVSPAVLKSELLDLAKLCQVVPGNGFLLRTLCGQLEGAVTAIFGPLALLLVMTEPSRRQVYFAVVARLEANGAFKAPGLDEGWRADLLTRLVISRNEDLIAYAYGNCPAGFPRLVGRLGDCARQPALYLELFGLLTVYPDLARSLLAACQGRPLTDELIKLMRELPPTPLGVRVAARFEAVEDYHKLMRPYQAITMSQQLTEVHMQRIAKGEAPGNLLEGLYLDLPFPAPVLNAPGFTHIVDGHALVRTSREFSNCLAGYVAEALNNERQYYLWHQSEAPEVVFAINREGPFGWYLSEAKLVDNARLPRKLRQKLNDKLGGHGIRTDASVEMMMEPYRNDRNNFMLDEFLDLEEAA